MYAVRLLRRRNQRDEEYGRVVWDNGVVRFDGLSSVFRASLMRGIEDGQRRYTPEDGLAFLECLQSYPFDHGLRASDIEAISLPSGNGGGAPLDCP